MESSLTLTAKWIDTKKMTLNDTLNDIHVLTNLLKQGYSELLLAWDFPV